MPLASLADTKAALGITGAAEDARLTALLASAEAQIARATGLSFTVAEHVEDHHGGVATLALRARPVVSITAVVDLATGETVDAATYALSGDLLRRLPLGAQWGGFNRVSPFRDPRGDAPGSRQPRWRVTMQAGYATAPGDLQGAAFEIVAAMRAQQGGVSSVKDGDFAQSFAAAPMSGIPASARAVIDAYRVVL